jgi:hypothetical protein
MIVIVEECLYVHCWTCTKQVQSIIEDHVMNKCQAALCYDAKFLNDDQRTTGYPPYPVFVLPLPFLNSEPHVLGVAAATSWKINT